MGRVAGAGNKPVLSGLTGLAAAGLAWAVIALFFAFTESTIRGPLDSGQLYTRHLDIRSYNSAGGWLLLLATTVNTLAATDLLRAKAGYLRSLFWATFSGIVLASTAFVGTTRIINWLPGIPPEILHGIGTPYVTVIETPLVNLPAVIGTLLAAGYVVAVIGYSVRELVLARRTPSGEQRVPETAAT